MTRSIALLGSTGSIGRQTLEVARELGLSVAALTANKSVDLIEQQAREFCPRLAVLYDEDAANELRARLSDTNTQVLSGMEGLLAAATADDADTVVTAVMGMIGLQPTLAAIEKKNASRLRTRKRSSARASSWWTRRKNTARRSSPSTASTARSSSACRAAVTAVRSSASF